jgi:hypothetical protein
MRHLNFIIIYFLFFGSEGAYCSEEIVVFLDEIDDLYVMMECSGKYSHISIV